MLSECEKCGRPIAARAYGGGVGPDPGTTCARKGSSNCVTATLAFQRGMREGVEIAKERACPTRDASGLVDETGRIDWSSVDAELARRCGDAE